VRLIGKGGKERLVPLNEESLSWVRRYLSESRPQLNKHHAATTCSPRAAAAA